ncbi:MAG: hypothetical protein HC912_10995, partial [Saprospiraceae bacterium]|nr:hypothetical protein [Saprospiraceae bacterium]
MEEAFRTKIHKNLTSKNKMSFTNSFRRKPLVQRGEQEGLVRFEPERVYYPKADFRTPLTPEEEVRIEAYLKLIFQYRYPPQRIAFEHQVKLHKSGVALLMAALCWTLYSFIQEDSAEANSRLSENLADTGQIVIFLLGAMIIVELVNTYRGFEMITALIRTRKALHLLWLVSGITFFMSAALDNLTTSIVMVSLTRKLSPDPKL